MIAVVAAEAASCGHARARRPRASRLGRRTRLDRDRATSPASSRAPRASTAAPCGSSAATRAELATRSRASVRGVAPHRESGRTPTMGARPSSGAARQRRLPVADRARVSSLDARAARAAGHRVGIQRRSRSALAHAAISRSLVRSSLERCTARDGAERHREPPSSRYVTHRTARRPHVAVRLTSRRASPVIGRGSSRCYGAGTSSPPLRPPARAGGIARRAVAPRESMPPPGADRCGADSRRTQTPNRALGARSDVVVDVRRRRTSSSAVVFFVPRRPTCRRTSSSRGVMESSSFERAVVGVRAEVLQVAGDLGVLRLLTAAPHA